MRRPDEGRTLPAILACLAFACAVSARADIEFFVAPDGDDGNTGIETRPFRTPAAARNAVRVLVARGLSDDVTVWFRSGTYRLTEPFLIGPADSGDRQHSITYAAYGAERAILTSAMPVGGWTSLSNGILEARLPDGVEPTAVFEGDTRLVAARWPDKAYLSEPAREDYLAVERPLDGVGGEFSYTAGDFPGRLDPAAWDISDARVVIWAGSDRACRRLRLDSVDADKRVMSLAPVVGTPLRRRDRYFVENIPSLLDQAGECVISLKNRKLLVWPRNAAAGTPTVSIPAADNVVTILGEGTNLVFNVHFRSLDLGICNDDVVRIANAEGCSVRFCAIENGTGCGVSVSEHARGISVCGNLIRYNGAHGVLLSGPGPGMQDVNRDNVIENNHIHHCGVLVGHACGVVLKSSGYNSVANNFIHDMPRHGVLLEDADYGRLCELVAGVTREARFDHLHTRNNVVAFNEIRRVDTDSQDAGAIESRCPGRDNVCRGNLIHDVGNSRFSLQAGICLGEGTDCFSVSNNIVGGVRGAGSYCVRVTGVGNTVRNNILVASPDTDAILRTSAWNDDTAQLDYTRNIFCMFKDRNFAHLFVRWSASMIRACDENVYWMSDGREPRFAGNLPVRDWTEWRTLLGGRLDAHSVMADPMFEDAARGNFSLKQGSPAEKLGFSQIDAGAAGLRKDFPARFER